MANFFSREAQVMLVWLILVPAIVLVFALVAVYFWRHV